MVERPKMDENGQKWGLGSATHHPVSSENAALDWPARSPQVVTVTNPPSPDHEPDRHLRNHTVLFS